MLDDIELSRRVRVCSSSATYIPYSTFFVYRAYRHWGCVTAKVISNMKEIFDDADDLDGFEDLKDEDQEKIRKAWEDGKVDPADIPESAKKPEEDEDEDEDEEDGEKKKKTKKSSKKEKKAEDDKGNFKLDYANSARSKCKCGCYVGCVSYWSGYSIRSFVFRSMQGADR